MNEVIQLGEIAIALTRKAIRNVHLSVHPPDGHVTLVAPICTRSDVARAYAVSKLGWIRDQQRKLRSQARETPRRFVTRESHYVWGTRYLLYVVEREQKPFVTMDHRRITLVVRPGSDATKRESIVHAWHKALLHDIVPSVIKKWEPRLNVNVSAYYVQRMKTKWGSCNYLARNIRLNTELVKKPRDLLEYVIVHEMAHLLAPTHDVRFVTLLDEHWPSWRDARTALNELPLSDVTWPSAAV